jgi:DNA-binding NtrC family response regulator
MTELVRMIERVAPADVPVLIHGETGCGKELVARAIHNASARRDQPLVSINCGAMSESILEAELFGAERGAYTTALSSRPGLMATADGGTLFLDEVGDMPPSMQVALLRALESGEVRAVGGSRFRKIDVRVIAASNKDLLELTARGQFREDLRFRLEVVRIRVPSLRDRLEDLPELCEHLLEDVCRRCSLPARHMSPEAMTALRSRIWPGNVRELRHVLASAALASDSPLIAVEALPPERRNSGIVPAMSGVESGHEQRAEAIRRALRITAGHRGRAAKMLGIARSTFYRYLELYGIDPAPFSVASGHGSDDS